MLSAGNDGKGGFAQSIDDFRRKKAETNHVVVVLSFAMFQRKQNTLLNESVTGRGQDGGNLCGVQMLHP